MANTYNWGAMRNDMVQSPLAIDDTMMATPSAAFGSGLSFDKPNKDDNPNLDVSNVDKQRKTFSPLAIMGSLFIDALGESAGVEGAKMGGTMERMAQARKLRAESDPEGTQADLNRAKLLSRRAAETDDPAKKAEYGAAIKKLFPMETQGLDDITASYLYMSDNDKLQLELLKGENALRKQMLINQGRIENTGLANEGKRDVANINALSREQVAALNNDTRREVAQLQAEARKAIAEGNNVRALEIADIVDQRMRDLAIVNGEYRLQNTGLANQGRMDVAGLNATAAMDRLLTKGDQDMRLQAAKYASDLAIEELRAKARADVANINAGARVSAAKASASAAGGQDLIGDRTTPAKIAEMKKANDNAGRWFSDYTYSASEMQGTQAVKEYQKFEGMAKQIVQDQLRKVYGSQFTEKEGERFFASMGLRPKMDPKVRWTLFINQINDLRAKAGLPAVSESGVELAPAQAAPTSAPVTEPPAQQSVGNKYKDSGLFV